MFKSEPSLSTLFNTLEHVESHRNAERVPPKETKLSWKDGSVLPPELMKENVDYQQIPADSEAEFTVRSVRRPEGE